MSLSVADDHPHAELGALGVFVREIARSDLRPAEYVDMATQLPVGPVYFRLMFGGYLRQDFANRVINNIRRGYAASTL